MAFDQTLDQSVRAFKGRYETQLVGEVARLQFPSTKIAHAFCEANEACYGLMRFGTLVVVLHAKKRSTARTAKRRSRRGS